MDELSAFAGASPRLKRLEQALFRHAQVVFTGGNSLFEAKAAQHNDISPEPSSIDADHFGKARSLKTEPEDQRAIAKPRIGFFGVIDERMDLGLVKALAALRPQWQLVMIGPVVKISESSLPQGPNLHWLGARQYMDLPAYLSGWYAGFMLFAINNSTRFISPTKTPEFLAAGVPVVSTAITDVVRPYGVKGLVEIASEPESFVLALERAMQRPRAPWLSAVDTELARTSWDLTWQRMSQRMRQAMTKRTRQPITPVVATVQAAGHV
jgi:glycosyltransferase involved in cell wall biosynthesis